MICVMKSSLKIVWKTKITFLLIKTLLFFLEQKYILFSETRYSEVKIHYLKYFGMLSSSVNLLLDIYIYALHAALVKLTAWTIKNDHVINCVVFFCKWFIHGQTSNVIWLSVKWLLIFRLEVANYHKHHKAC